MPIQFSHAIRQSIGQREQQEDSADRFVIEGRVTNPSELLTVIADGMGGHHAGEKASSIAVKEFISHFREEKDLDLKERLSTSVFAANQLISDEIARNPTNYSGMGTTLLAFATDGEALSWASVGDSPLLLFRNDTVVQLNEDHSMAPIIEEFIVAGVLPAEARHTHPYRHSLRSAISGNDIPELDVQIYDAYLQSSDILIGCSDGLLTLELEEIAEVIRTSSPTTAGEVAENLMAAVQQAEHPYQDNTTIAVIFLS